VIISNATKSKLYASPVRTEKTAEGITVSSAIRNPLPSHCPGAFTSRIVGGTEPRFGAYPWLALLGFTRDKKDIPLWKCGGALIGYKYVLTAAHCVVRLPGKYRM